VPLLNYALAFALQLRKSTENLNQSSRVATGLLVAPTWLSFEGLPRLACCTSVHLGYPGDFCQPSVGTAAFRVTVARCSPYQLTSSRNSVNAVMWSAKNGIPKTSLICLLQKYHGALVAMRRHLDCSTCSFLTWLRAADLQIGHA
jgi:hypothetical protein